MNRIFLVFGIACSSAAGAQKHDLFRADEYLKKKSNASRFPSLPIAPAMGDRNSNQFNTANENSVITLPVDNMPCVKADMTRFNQMPNFSDTHTKFQFQLIDEGNKPGSIPNAAPLVIKERPIK